MRGTRVNNRANNLVIGTHDGVFHSDEIIAIALWLWQNNIDINSVNIVRSRDKRDIESCDILIDVGNELKGNISLYTFSSLTFRAISCVYCDPKSTINTLGFIGLS